MRKLGLISFAAMLAVASPAFAQHWHGGGGHWHGGGGGWHGGRGGGFGPGAAIAGGLLGLGAAGAYYGGGYGYPYSTYPSRCWWVQDYYGPRQVCQ